ncbi:MAG: hypothetical protein HIU91_06810 [Acidobacteria bacterium]|nr:hypothetical protein [Acidobacteriota bacterium]
MANMLIPVEERHLTPEQVDLLDARRRRGQALLVIGFQTFIIGTLITIWAGQDLTYSPGWAHPMAYWDGLLFLASLVSFVWGIRLKRGSNEFLSY